MRSKLFEIRDKGTFIPVVAVRLDPLCMDQSEQDSYLIRRAGWSTNPGTLLTKLEGGRACYDSYDWGDRTMAVAHRHIAVNWHALESGQVVDVEFILKETASPKVSEANNTCQIMD